MLRNAKDLETIWLKSNLTTSFKLVDTTTYQLKKKTKTQA